MSKGAKNMPEQVWGIFLRGTDAPLMDKQWQAMEPGTAGLTP